jgi:hypothetical protein
MNKRIEAKNKCHIGNGNNIIYLQCLIFGIDHKYAFLVFRSYLPLGLLHIFYTLSLFYAYD